MLQISRLFMYPIKSCAGMEVSELTLDAWGAVGDRRFVLADAQGQFLTQRQLPQMQRIQPRWQGDDLQVVCAGHADLLVPAAAGAGECLVQVWKDSVAAQDCGEAAADWFSTVLGVSCRLLRLPQQRFPATQQRRVNPKYTEQDHWLSFADGFPLLLVNQSSLDALGQTLGRPLDVIRFRPNVVLSGAQAWQELRWSELHNDDGGTLMCCKPCERCVIPTRHPQTLAREADVLEALKAQCRIDGKIIFGQNALFHELTVLRRGDTFRAG
ncbi:MOSC domain-containing protein [Venatoribacter cucullus]|uniref:MOSC domain-containing protein n=1 Tax=Venatoribacter cucullus TaxID=2661630 RepID=A0A9X7YPI1_9GAMM|nr:MOSC N-terminal beta barrel domain-containing protein [Venatoribacter cucullus]QQD21363.1 MOSC domain-containing protein [Oceanospirillaceae bacterium ASx5O]QQD24042.1 MOSC domain-containing protein [Venatoribacter cucullus]